MRSLRAGAGVRGRGEVRGVVHDPGFVSPADREEIVAWLGQIRPLWENRFTAREAERRGGQRRLLRPVLWLGSWQFACLDYYRPPAGVADRCVRAEPYPPVLTRLVARIEELARAAFVGVDLPRGWSLNTCLVNLYGTRVDDGARVDTARVGDHRDFEPGPVASISLGDRALFQFVARGRVGEGARVLDQRWLEDGSLLVFGGEPWKSLSVHRVLRVETRRGETFCPQVAGFETRRVNFTFRYVPAVHVARFADLAPEARADVRGYVAELARTSPYWQAELAAERGEALEQRRGREPGRARVASTPARAGTRRGP